MPVPARFHSLSRDLPPGLGSFLSLYSIFKVRNIGLATNLPDLQTALRFYKRRMWIEEMFGDLKDHGFDLECTMLHSFVRLSRLTLAVAFLYVWLVSSGVKTIHAGLRHLVDRKDRRDLSIFQIGLRFIERRLVNNLSFQLPLCTYL